MSVTFDPYVRFAKMRYRWNPWVRPNPMDHMTSFSAILDFPPFWIFSKVKLNFQLSQILPDFHENVHTWSSDHSSQRLLRAVSKFQSVRLSQWSEYGGEAAKQEVRSYLRSGLTFQVQIWYIDLLPHSKGTQQIWWPLTSGGRYNMWKWLIGH